MERELSPDGPRASRPRATSAALSAKIADVIIRSAAVSAASNHNTTPTPAGSPDAIRLERFTVRERQLPKFKPRDLLTYKGKLALARLRYPGLGPLGDSMALSLLEDDFAAERRRELDDLEEVVEVSAGTPSPETKGLFDGVRFRPHEFPWR